jgi:hypothetical protein
MTPEQEQKLNEVYAFMQKLGNAATIPREVDVAITDRLKRKALLGLTVSGKDPDDEDQTVQEGGALSYSVLGDPDGFFEHTEGGTTRYIPFFL